MKRHDSLIALSRDHHEGLLLAARLQQGKNALLHLWSHDPRWQAEYVVKFFDDHLVPHFEAEEKVLFPTAESYLKELLPMAHRLIEEHAQMRSFAVYFRRPDEKMLEANLQQFGKLLEEHIRCEEREFFPKCEASIPIDVLIDIKKDIEQYSPQRNK